MKSFTAHYQSKTDPSKKITLRFWARDVNEAAKEANNFMLIDRWNVELEENGNSGQVDSK